MEVARSPVLRLRTIVILVLPILSWFYLNNSDFTNFAPIRVQARSGANKTSNKMGVECRVSSVEKFNNFPAKPQKSPKIRPFLTISD
jgi:hypothetical protein